MTPNPIVHVELSAVDPQAAGRFYENVFGWTVRLFPGSDYLTFEAAPGPGGGFNKIDDRHPRGEIVPYLQVDDIEAMLKEIEAAGGKTVQGKTEIAGEGFYALFEDPSGNRLGLFSG